MHLRPPPGRRSALALVRKFLALCCVTVALSATTPSRAELRWVRQEGAWEVALYHGERGDAWCAWRTSWAGSAGIPDHSLAFQMRGNEVVLFVFLSGDPPVPWHPGDVMALEGGARQRLIELDLARRLPNGFTLARGVVEQGADAPSRFATEFARVSSAHLVLPGGDVWRFGVSSLQSSLPILLRCLSEAGLRDSTPVPQERTRQRH